jgi:hypothetical protein
MKELFAAFNADFFRALTTIILPGAIAASSWSVYLFMSSATLRALVSQNHVETALVLFLVIVFLGLVIEDIGARVESWLDCAMDKRTGSVHTKEWYAYLRTAFVCEPIGRRYIRTLVTRLKFELGTSIAALIAASGLLMLLIMGLCTRSLSAVLIFLCVFLALYLGLAEAPASHKLLARARTEMLQEIRFVKPDSMANTK